MSESPRSPVVPFAAVFVLAVVSLFAYPVAEDDPETGRVLGKIELADMGPGERAVLPFWVNDTYTRLGASYNITEAAHLRLAFLAPDGERTEADVAGNALRLSVPDPAEGRWRLEVRTLDEPGLRGHLEHGWFYALGFGGPLSPP